MGTHQELEMFGSQPAYPEKLLHKKESLQNQLINIRVELSQASTVTGSPSALVPGCGTVSPTRRDLFSPFLLKKKQEGKSPRLAGDPEKPKSLSGDKAN